MRLTFTDAEFEQLRELLGKSAGLVFDDSRRDALSFCVSERMRQTGIEDVAVYLAMLIQPASEAERQALLDEVTIPETHFFRNPPQIHALRRHVLPQLIKDAGERGRKLTVWSAGCSTGEEPYTIAMLIRELLPLTQGWDVKVIATDISRRGLATAKAARYGERSLVMTEPDDVSRFFTRDIAGREAAYVVRPEIAELVEFRRHNLVTEGIPFAPGEVDLVMCRNVTIYFDRETTRSLVGRLHDSLRDGGYLFLGHAETLWQVSDAFHLVTLGDAFVYRRDDAADAGEAERRNVLPDRRSPGRSDRWGLERRSGRDRRGDTTPAPRGLVATIGRVLTTPIGPGASRQAPPKQDIPAQAPPAPAPLPVTKTPEPAPVTEVRRALADGRYGDAVALAERMAEAQPLAPDAHYLRGLALTNMGRDAEALVDLRKAIYLDSGFGFAHFLLAGALARLGESVAAVRSYRAAADVLQRMPPDVAADELGGRKASELAALCTELADRLGGKS
ncbi:MAG: chemotaxis protein methyltransferase CheR [Frankiales bacterium]|nr:chemotaxis protein methyltransferase CheR [Frankiales bacterium]